MEKRSRTCCSKRVGRKRERVTSHSEEKRRNRTTKACSGERKRKKGTT